MNGRIVEMANQVKAGFIVTKKAQLDKQPKEKETKNPNKHKWLRDKNK